MHREGFLMERIADTDNLLLAYFKASQGKREKAEVRAFAEHLDEEILSMRRELLEGQVRVGDYDYFHIRDPKPRRICAAAFRERVLHHALMNVCHPYFERHLIADTYATRPGKGLYRAIDKARQGLRSENFVAKCDFRKYFDSIDHAILKSKLRGLFKDKTLLAVFDTIIDSYHVEAGKGLPIGNLTSQYFANYYLSAMDHRIKEELQVRHYVRYMDDFLVFDQSREALAEKMAAIYAYASGLSLQLKPIVQGMVSSGVSFLGYKLYPEKILLNGRSKRRFVKKITLYESLLEEDVWSEQEFAGHVVPLVAFSRHGYTKGLRRKTINNVGRHG